jgi:hypothetical protein
MGKNLSDSIYNGLTMGDRKNLDYAIGVINGYLEDPDNRDNRNIKNALALRKVNVYGNSSAYSSKCPICDKHYYGNQHFCSICSRAVSEVYDKQN